MSASPSAAAPRLFYHPAYWCHSCDMSIGLPPSPTSDALLCPHCHRDSLEQMEMEEYVLPVPPLDSLSSVSFTPSDDNFLLTSPYLRRLIHHLTNAAVAEVDPRSDPAPRSSINSLQEVSITPESDPVALCPVCKDPFAVGSLAKMMPCNHAYHPDCIVPWLEINNSCPVCRFKLPDVNEANTKESGQVEGYAGATATGLEELVDDEADLFFFQNTLRHMARRNRWNEESRDIGSRSERHLFSPTEVETLTSEWVEPSSGGAGADEGGGSFGRSS